MMQHNSAVDLRRDVAKAARPPVDVSVSDAAAEYVRVRLPGGGVGRWESDITPYMVEPMDMLRSRAHDSVIFVGPAQSGKTQALIDCWLGYMVMCEPSDMTILQTSMETARDFDKRRIRRLHRNSPAIKKRMGTSPRHDNTFDKIYQSGAILSLGWPSIRQLSGRPIKFIALTDYDRMPPDIDKEGSPFALARKRTQTFLSRGMTLAESSPGYDVNDPNWSPRTPHEAPPAAGIFALFNSGDRRRFYWPCPDCGEYFLQPADILGFAFEEKRDLFGVIDNQNFGDVTIPCRKCGTLIDEGEKKRMTAAGLWVPENCSIIDGQVVGDPRQTSIASFWLPGAAAAYQSWRSIVQNYLDALFLYETTGSEEQLKTTVNVDQGNAYLPRNLASAKSGSQYAERAEASERGHLPDGARFITAAIDVQKKRFVVQVQAWGMGLECWIIDRFDVQSSERLDADGRVKTVDPSGHPEDWDVLVAEVLNKEYGGHRPRLVACDSGGTGGVTQNAYEFWTRCRRAHQIRNLVLVKGADSARMPERIRETWPDSTNRKDRRANAAGRVPVFLLNANKIKDTVNSDLGREDPGPRYMHFGDWLDKSFFEELVAEIRTEKGWMKVRAGENNEGLDLMYYNRAMTIMLKCDKIDWDRPPGWMIPSGGNDDGPRKSGYFIPA